MKNTAKKYNLFGADYMIENGLAYIQNPDTGEYNYSVCPVSYIETNGTPL